MASIRGGIDLPENLPLAWREAVAPSIVPSIIGIASLENNLEPYAIVWRFQPTPGLVRQNHGPFSLISQKPLSNTQGESMFQWFSHFLALRKAPVFIKGILPDASGQPIEIYGGFNGHVWHTNIKLNQGNHPIQAKNGLDLTALPQSWGTLQQALAANLKINLDQSPESVAWEVKDAGLSYLHLEYAQGIPTSTAIQLLGNYGFFDTEEMTLPDGTTIEEYRNPEKRFASNQSGVWQSSSTRILIQNNVLELGQTTTSTTQDCSEPSIFRLDKESLGRIFQAVGASSTPEEQISGFIEHGQLHICVE